MTVASPIASLLAALAIPPSPAAPPDTPGAFLDIFTDVDSPDAATPDAEVTPGLPQEEQTEDRSILAAAWALIPPSPAAVSDAVPLTVERPDLSPQPAALPDVSQPVEAPAADESAPPVARRLQASSPDTCPFAPAPPKPIPPEIHPERALRPEAEAPGPARPQETPPVAEDPARGERKFAITVDPPKPREVRPIRSSPAELMEAPRPVSAPLVVSEVPPERTPQEPPPAPPDEVIDPTRTVAPEPPPVATLPPATTAPTTLPPATVAPAIMPPADGAPATLPPAAAEPAIVAAPAPRKRETATPVRTPLAFAARLRPVAAPPPEPPRVPSPKLETKSRDQQPAPPLKRDEPERSQAPREDASEPAIERPSADRRIEWTAAPQTDDSPAAVPDDAPDAPAPTGPKPAARRDLPFTPPVARDIRLEVASPERKVEVRLVERSGEVHLAVRTPDARLTESLRGELPSLSSRLEQSGFRAEEWRVASASGAERRIEIGGAATSSPDTRQQGQPGGGEHERREQQRAPREPETPRSAPKKGAEFAWLMQSLR